MEDKKKVAENKKTTEQMPQKWHCDIYCRKVRHITCEGAEGIDPNAPDLCPYYDEMLY